MDLLLLATVRDMPGHGYAIIQELKRRSGGALDLPEGTIYPALHRLEEAGFLRSRWTRSAGRRRCVYDLTSPGRQELATRQREWSRLTTAVSAVLQGAS